MIGYILLLMNWNKKDEQSHFLTLCIWGLFIEGNSCPKSLSNSHFGGCFIEAQMIKISSIWILFTTMPFRMICSFIDLDFKLAFHFI